MKARVSKSIVEAARSQGAVLLAKAAAVLMFAVALMVTSANAQRVYVVTGNQQFGTVDLGSGAFHQIGAPTPEGQANLVWGPQGILYSLTYSGNLEKIDPATGQTTVIGPTGLGFNAFELAGVRGQLYVTDFSNNIYSVNPQTGAASFLASTGIPADPAAPFSSNPDGTINFCDETFYGIAGKIYATFDAFTIDPGSLAMNATVQPGLYEIDPTSGLAMYIGPTDLNLGATVAVNGGVYAFKWNVQGFGEFGPIVQSAVLRLDISSGHTALVANVDPAAGGITGAAPVLGRRW